MYKFFFIFIVSFFSAQQNCDLSFSNSQMLQDGTVIFNIKNMGNTKVKIPELFNADFARPANIEVYNVEKDEYVDTKYHFSGAACGNVKKCLGKMIRLEKGGSKEYEVKIIPGRISSALREKKKYRFKLSFDTYLFSGCKDYVTDWLYFDNTK